MVARINQEELVKPVDRLTKAENILNETKVLTIARLAKMLIDLFGSDKTFKKIGKKAGHEIELYFKELNEYINEKTENVFHGYKKSIGLRNVNMRIKLAYGDSYGIQIKSRENMGTSVLLKLPLYGYDGGDLNV